MFDLVSNIKDVKFLDVTPVTPVKTKIEYRDELLAFGLKMDSRFFTIEGGIAPLYLAFADSKFTEKFGNRPRMSLCKGAENDARFISVCEQYGITPINNSGGTVEGYDFDSANTMQELFSFMVGFEQAYRQVKIAA